MMLYKIKINYIYIIHVNHNQQKWLVLHSTQKQVEGGGGSPTAANGSPSNTRCAGTGGLPYLPHQNKNKGNTGDRLLAIEHTSANAQVCQPTY